MGEGSNDPHYLLPPDIPTLVQRCLKVEQDRSLSDNSIKELRRYKERQGLLLRNLSDYLSTGGYPEIVTGNLEGKHYLATLFDSIFSELTNQRFKFLVNPGHLNP